MTNGKYDDVTFNDIWQNKVKISDIDIFNLFRVLNYCINQDNYGGQPAIAHHMLHHVKNKIIKELIKKSKNILNEHGIFKYYKKSSNSFVLNLDDHYNRFFSENTLLEDLSYEDLMIYFATSIIYKNYAVANNIKSEINVRNHIILKAKKDGKYLSAVPTINAMVKNTKAQRYCLALWRRDELSKALMIMKEAISKENKSAQLARKYLFENIPDVSFKQIESIYKNENCN